jgi:prefoldin subunit 5
MSDLTNIVVANFTELFRRLDMMDERLARIDSTIQEVHMDTDDIDSALATLEATAARTQSVVDAAVEVLKGVADLGDSVAADPVRVSAVNAKVREAADKLANAIASFQEEQPGGPSLGPQPGPTPNEEPPPAA